MIQTVFGLRVSLKAPGKAVLILALKTREMVLLLTMTMAWMMWMPQKSVFENGKCHARWSNYAAIIII